MTSNIPNRRPRISRRPHITTALVHTTTNIPKRDLRILCRSQLHYCSRTYLLILLFYRFFPFDSHSAPPGVVVLSPEWRAGKWERILDAGFGALGLGLLSGYQTSGSKEQETTSGRQTFHIGNHSQEVNSDRR